MALRRIVRAMDRLLMPSAGRMTLAPTCAEVEGEVGADRISVAEAREIMAEIDAKSSALLAVLAIIVAVSAFLFSLDHGWVTILLMFAQVATVSVSILFLLRCLVYEPAPHLAALFGAAGEGDALQIEAIKQVRYFNRVIVLTGLTFVLFFLMAAVVGVDAMAARG